LQLRVSTLGGHELRDNISMDLANRSAILTEVATLARAMSRPVPSGWGAYEYLHCCHEIDRLRQLLAVETNALADFIESQVISLANGGSGMSIQQLDRWLIQRAVATSAEQAVNELVTFVNANQIDCTFIYGLIGVAVHQPVRITNEVSIIPFNQSQLKHQTEDRYAPIARMSAALALPMKHPKLIRQANASVKAIEIFETALAHFEAIRLCLGLVKPWPSAVAFESYLVPESNPAMSSATTARSRYNADWIEPVVYDEADGQRAAEIFQLFVNCPAKLKPRIMVILHRFQAGMPKIPTVDSAIDLGIILESLFLPDASAELSYRLKVRAAKLLGATPNERQELAKQLARIYDIRSTAVHTGELPARPNLQGFASVGAIIRHGYALAARATEEVLKRQIEDWDRLLLS